ncbi:MAG: hypothetical protein A2921_00635 [Candidatus Magasanikbacteria bacterium RIFCSPLOWO2_01_FULL_43_20b]|uniref:Uncharacterized protein n=1 Tax=Candidatus Magasanikbacteria bacterium RIFCSPLOWO2_12_FULL_43_12 TaxID=1798692 RepID=A0A1F6MVL7_9BACT|nr:MAG: hypothetical protein A3I93_01150 [Candidatus Magasanikbacteria bacterium RIFCSPLOWO2_02_FULL_43_22]OGH72130.1 MAG: hypothetical protein A3C74_04155 [Candidatus Magasanikbacteria bacterium RIFCSPHIGHO2_02_FULL_44_13]OGH72917.1 MAG: hypothetical protein A2921_00635 [Candidatus Magasanikbacteria bacterium RIFCSPLOWO2_01_FULL_43_20b]OGH75651.1 MAG: hypothetical protein A3G00_04115 [Candidatus Magasanikbacteria bacterium RIFCSPLOWO2_12_FULL_43_12]
MKTDTSQKILDFIKKNRQASPKKLVNYTGFGAPAIFRQLKKLQNRGLLAKTGKPPRVYYHLPLEKNLPKINNVSEALSVTIHLKKFGRFLSARPYGQQTWLALQPLLAKKISGKEKIFIDFAGVQVLCPGWADEFISSLKKRYPKQVVLLPSNNASVKMSLEFVGG